MYFNFEEKTILFAVKTCRQIEKERKKESKRDKIWTQQKITPFLDLIYILLKNNYSFFVDSFGGVGTPKFLPNTIKGKKCYFQRDRQRQTD